MIIKVCGLRDAENIRAVETAAAPDWAGFIFYPNSPRFVAKKPDYLPDCRRVGVFVDPTEAEVMQRVKEFTLWGVQLYAASPSLCLRLHNKGLHVIVALAATGDLDATAAPFADVASHFLFDTPTAGYGGSGHCFDHSVLNTYHGHVPFLLSGGLNPQSIPAIRSIGHPRFDGIDLNSGFETAPALKDPIALRDFVRALRYESTSTLHE